MKTQELREKFIHYFNQLSHTIVPSSSLIPGNDPTLLFTNSGMVQFKDVFLGLEQRSYSRAASVQRCMRAGGKHNDLENVGYTARHHTLFEMLGNFSFGDYFKRDAIQYAWRFLTEELGLPKERLWITVYHEDSESESIWLNEMKVDPARFSRCGEKDNFWQMGDIGPCGPCTEIFYDHGPTVKGGPPGSPGADGDRYVEIWNLVFMQYERDIKGQLLPLPKPCVDTGMGLERIAAVMQGVHDNYEIDLFQYLLKSLSQLIGYKDIHHTSMRVIVDHIRACSFLIMDGVVPSNEGRGYVLRRIMRRAARHGYQLGQTEPFFYRLVPALVKIMGEAYPDLVSSQVLIERIIEQEEIQFSKTLNKGLKILDQSIKEITGHRIPGDIIFQLYDTYGFPVDLTADIARERGYEMDYAGFQTAMEGQRSQSQNAHQFTMDHTQRLHIAGETEFVGYETLNADAVVTTLLQDNKPVNVLKSGEVGTVVLDQTPFYAESGGQVGDAGYLHFEGGHFRVKDTQKQGQVYLHVGELVQGVLSINQKVRAEVDSGRLAIALNHSATHLLHAALRKILGPHVMQKGSLVEAVRLRFDFSHPEPMTLAEMQAVERLVNQQIRANLPTETEVTSPEQAKAHGALALFGERYGQEVRVLRMGDFSTEICGGTHVNRTGDIGLFKVVSESGVASGIRRIEAVTGAAAEAFVAQHEQSLQQIAELLKSDQMQMMNKLMQLIENKKQLEREITQLKQKTAHQQTGQFIENAVEIDGVWVLAACMENTDPEILRNTVDSLKQKRPHSAIVLATVIDQKVFLISSVTKDCLSHFNATELLNVVAKPVGGKGGGRPDLAQGGGDNPAALKAALASVPGWVRTAMQSRSGNTH